MTVAALDLGSNSFHLLVARVLRGGKIVKVGSSKRTLRLGDVVAAHGSIPQPVIERSLVALGEMLRAAHELDAQCVAAVGTSALRDASNGADFVREAQRRLGLSVDILAGNEEGELVYRGACQGLAQLPRRRLVVDMGGGSIELAVGNDDKCVAVDSLSLGFLRVARELNASEVLDASQLERVDQYVRLKAGAAAERIRSMRPEVCLLSGGTARNLLRVATTLGFTELSTESLRVLATRFTNCNHDQLVAIGVSRERVRTFALGVNVLARVIELLEPLDVRVSAGGLREGVLLHRFGASRRSMNERRRSIGASPFEG